MTDREARIESGASWVYMILPLVPLVLLNLLSKNHFVRRHTQQGLALGLIFWWAVLFISGLSDQLCLGALVSFFVVWIGGVIWGRRQVRRGDCWLMRQLGEGKRLPRPWASSLEQRPERAAPVTSAKTLGRYESPTTAISRGQMLLNQGRRDEAIEQFLFAFRSGQPEIRRRAIFRLKKIGEMEEF